MRTVLRHTLVWPLVVLLAWLSPASTIYVHTCMGSGQTDLALTRHETGACCARPEAEARPAHCCAHDAPVCAEEKSAHETADLPPDVPVFSCCKTGAQESPVTSLHRGETEVRAPDAPAQQPLFALDRRAFAFESVAPSATSTAALSAADPSPQIDGRRIRILRQSFQN